MKTATNISAGWNSHAVIVPHCNTAYTLVIRHIRRAFLLSVSAADDWCKWSSLVFSVKGYTSPLHCGNSRHGPEREGQRDRWVSLAGYPVLSTAAGPTLTSSPLLTPRPAHSLGSTSPTFPNRPNPFVFSQPCFLSFLGLQSHSQVSLQFARLPFPFSPFFFPPLDLLPARSSIFVSPS